MNYQWLAAVAVLVIVGVLVTTGFLDSSMKDTIIGVVLGGAGVAGYQKATAPKP